MATTRVDRVQPTAALVAVVALAVAVLGLSSEPALAAPAAVAVRDNTFEPREVHIDPGDSVVWSYEQGQNAHTVTSDERGQFSSGDMTSTSNPTFSHTFEQEGYYPYFCRYHGARGGLGMAGLVVVGDPPEPPPGTDPVEHVERPRLVVPRDYPTIQQAVDVAQSGSTVVIQPGTYRESVVVATPGLVIRGVDRFRSVLHGTDSKDNGIVVQGTSNVHVKNLTVRNYLHSGILLDDVSGYVVSRIDSIKNRTFGIRALGSYKGVIRNSFGWGSGDSAFSIAHCLGCSTVIDNVRSETNYLGYSGTNATGVIIRGSRFSGNGAGIVPNTRTSEELGPNRGTAILDNRVVGNNYETIPAAGLSESIGIPFGTGIWLAGVHNNVATRNVVRDHKRYGILITQSFEADSMPLNNRVRRNVIRSAGVYDLAYDGTGYDNCFYGNDHTGPTGPPEAETLYGCPNRPNVGVPFAPVQAEVLASLPTAETRDQSEPPEPDRPSCQRGTRGCDR